MTNTKHYDPNQDLNMRQKIEMNFVMPKIEISQAHECMNLFRATMSLPTALMDRMLRAAIDAMPVGAERSIAIEMQNELSREIRKVMVST